MTNLKINDKTNLEEFTFSDLLPGDIFSWKDGGKAILLKTHDNVVSLSSSTIYSEKNYNNSERVKIYKNVEIILKE